MAPWRCFVLGATTATRHPVMWCWYFSNRSTSCPIAARTASDGSAFSKLICNGICMNSLFLSYLDVRHQQRQLKSIAAATIVADVKRFCHRVKRTKFSAHTGHYKAEAISLRRTSELSLLFLRENHVPVIPIALETGFWPSPLL